MYLYLNSKHFPNEGLWCCKINCSALWLLKEERIPPLNVVPIHVVERTTDEQYVAVIHCSLLQGGKCNTVGIDSSSPLNHWPWFLCSDRASKLKQTWVGKIKCFYLMCRPEGRIRAVDIFPSDAPTWDKSRGIRMRRRCSAASDLHLLFCSCGPAIHHRKRSEDRWAEPRLFLEAPASAWRRSAFIDLSLCQSPGQMRLQLWEQIDF